MNLFKKVSNRFCSYIIKIFAVSFCCYLTCMAIYGYSEVPSKNAVRLTNSIYTQKNANNEYFNSVMFSTVMTEDSATLFYNLGWQAYKKSNFDNARYYWEKGSLSTTDNPDKFNCLFRLGLLQQTGEGVNINLESAFNYYMKASNNGKPGGNLDATKNIGTFYENGMFVTKDNKKALEWYTKAKEQGNKFCDDDIIRVKKNMYDLFEDIKKP